MKLARWPAARDRRVKIVTDDVTLGALRCSLGISQRQLAKRLGVTQSSVSSLERRRDPETATLRRAIEALGGRLELTVVLDGRRYRLGG